LDLNQTRRRLHRRQLRARLEIARHPTALHEHHGAARLQLQWRADEKPAPLHLAVVQIDRVRGQPTAREHHAAVQQRLDLFAGALRVLRQTEKSWLPSSAGSAARSAMEACSASFCAARPSCQRPRASVSTTPHTAASVISQKRPPRSWPCEGVTISRMKYVVLVAFLAIFASLGAALFFMMRGDRSDKSKGHYMARALAVRVGLSIALFLGILLAWKLGYIQPTGLQASP